METVGKPISPSFSRRICKTWFSGI
ncbi:protein of unknown function [Streptomyces sp. KY70]|nr:protein of unknown function [Streptomyces sp. KY70]